MYNKSPSKNWWQLVPMLLRPKFREEKILESLEHVVANRGGEKLK